MTEQEIANILNNVAGSPNTGVVAEIIPAMARAIHRAMIGDDTGETPGKDSRHTRVVKATETR